MNTSTQCWRQNGSKWLDDNDSCVKSFPSQPLSVTVEEAAPVKEETPLEEPIWEETTSVEEVTP